LLSCPPHPQDNFDLHCEDDCCIFLAFFPFCNKISNRFAAVLMTVYKNCWCFLFISCLYWTTKHTSIQWKNTAIIQTLNHARSSHVFKERSLAQFKQLFNSLRKTEPVLASLAYNWSADQEFLLWCLCTINYWNIHLALDFAVCRTSARWHSP